MHEISFETDGRRTRVRLRVDEEPVPEEVRLINEQLPDGFGFGHNDELGWLLIGDIPRQIRWGEAVAVERWDPPWSVVDAEFADERGDRRPHR